MLFQPIQGELTERLHAMRRVFLLVGAFSLAIHLLLLMPALYMLQTYDRVLTSRNEGTLLALTLLLAGLLLLEAGIELVRSRVLLRVAAALDLQIGPRVFDAMFIQALRGDTQSGQALADLGRVRQFLAGRGLLAFFDAPWAPLYLLVVGLLHPWLGVFAVLAAALLFAMAWLNERATGRLHAQAVRQGAGVGHFTATTLRNAEVIEAMGMLPALRQRWLSRQEEYLGVGGEAGERGAAVGAGLRFARQFLQSGILGLGAYLVLQGQMTAGGMVAASLLLGRALAPVDQAVGAWREVVAAREAYARLTGLLRVCPPEPARLALPDPRGEITLENLVVAAPGSSEPILKGLSLRLSAGSVTAVVGPSACGKSTLARALVGVWPPAAGTVRLDGAELTAWSRDALGPWIGYLPQDVELFDGTVAENIARLAEPDAAQVVQAAQRAGVHELILRLPQGYQTRIGEGGVMLSAGQRQRVALARALYGEPVLIVLDEPNAHLDEAGDAALLQALRRMREEGRTVVVVTHRANLLAATDAVLVLAAGKAQAYGPRHELVKPLTVAASRTGSHTGEPDKEVA